MIMVATISECNNNMKVPIVVCVPVIVTNQKWLRIYVKGLVEKKLTWVKSRKDINDFISISFLIDMSNDSSIMLFFKYCRRKRS